MGRNIDPRHVDGLLDDVEEGGIQAVKLRNVGQALLQGDDRCEIFLLEGLVDAACQLRGKVGAGRNTAVASENQGAEQIFVESGKHREIGADRLDQMNGFPNVVERIDGIF